MPLAAPIPADLIELATTHLARSASLLSCHAHAGQRGRAHAIVRDTFCWKAFSRRGASSSRLARSRWSMRLFWAAMRLSASSRALAFSVSICGEDQAVEFLSAVVSTALRTFLLGRLQELWCALRSSSAL